MRSAASARGVVGAFIRRDFQIARSTRLAVLLEIAAIGFTLLTFVLLARVVEPGAVAGGYFAFATVGLALGDFLGSAVAVVAGNLRQEQVQGTMESVLSRGLSVGVLGGAMAAYPLLASMVRAFIYLGLAAALGARAPGANWPLAIAAMTLGSLAFAGLGLIGAGLVIILRQAAAATAWLVSVLALAGGALFPPRLLPSWARTLAELSPFTHTLRVARGALLEGVDWSSALGELAILTVLAIVLVAGGVAALGGGLARARRTGTIAQY